MGAGGYPAVSKGLLVKGEVMKGQRILSGMLGMRRGVAVLLLCALMPMLFCGCYGKFQLTKNIYDWNGKVSDNRWLKSLTMWGLLIIPVYTIGMLGDAIIFNLIEFWGGENPLTASTVVDADGTEYALKPGATPSEAVLTVSRDGQVVAEQRFVKVSDTVIEVRGADGALQGKVLRGADGSMSLTDGSSAVVERLPAESLACLATK